MWTPVLPFEHAEGVETQLSFCSFIWVNKGINFRQIKVKLSDLTAILVRVKERTILIFSCYIPPVGANHVTELRERLELIQKAWAELQMQEDTTVELFIAGDFNHHNQL